MYLYISTAHKAWEEAVDAFLSAPDGEEMLRTYTPEMRACLHGILTAMILPPHGASTIERRLVASYADALLRARLERGSIPHEWVACAKAFRERIRAAHPDRFDGAYVSMLHPPERPSCVTVIETADIVKMAKVEP